MRRRLGRDHDGRRLLARLDRLSGERADHRVRAYRQSQRVRPNSVDPGRLAVTVAVRAGAEVQSTAPEIGGCPTRGAELTLDHPVLHGVSAPGAQQRHENKQKNPRSHGSRLPNRTAWCKPPPGPVAAISVRS